MPDHTDPPAFAEWCIVELFGHQRYAGLVRQADWPPGFARLEIPATPGHDAVTQLLSPQSIYRLTPTTEAVATAVAERCRPEPVHRWELPAAPTREDIEDLVADREDDGLCGDCMDGKCHGTDPDDCGCARHAASVEAAELDDSEDDDGPF